MGKAGLGWCWFPVAAILIPLSVAIAAILETPVVTKLDGPKPGATVPWATDEAARSKADASGALKLPETTDFGKANESWGAGQMFDRIAFAYDSTNKYMSLGLDQYWRTYMLKDCMSLEAKDRVLDLATGTADVGLLAAAKLRELSGSQQPSTPPVLGVDPSSEMLRHGVSKTHSSGMTSMLTLVKGDAQDLSAVRDLDIEGKLWPPRAGVDSSSIDKISMSFGIRNVPDRPKALREMWRVLKKSADHRSRVCILELSLPTGETTMSFLAKAFIEKVVPAIGFVATMGSGGKEYEYLEKSILHFPKPRDFAAEMTKEGLHVQSITSFGFGAVHLYNAMPLMPASS